MYRNPFWMLFLSLVLIGILGYTGCTLVKVWRYVRLDRQTAVHEIQWSVLALSDEAFVPLASYSFLVQGKNYQGETRWNETYLNQWTAQEAITRLQQSPPQVWYDSSDPEISSLQKHFPIKQSLYAALLWLLGLYFIGLGYYVNRRFS
jgi:hypothetical protein